MIVDWSTSSETTNKNANGQQDLWKFQFDKSLKVVMGPVPWLADNMEQIFHESKGPILLTWSDQSFMGKTNKQKKPIKLLPEQILTQIKVAIWCH